MRLLLLAILAFVTLTCVACDQDQRAKILCQVGLCDASGGRM